MSLYDTLVAFSDALDDDRRIANILAAVGSIADAGHEWDEEPAAWVRAQRSSDPQRVG